MDWTELLQVLIGERNICMALKKYVNTFTVGLFLFVLFIVQFVFHLQWKWLFDIQQQEMYKRWSGLFLGLFIVFQWLLTIFRLIPRLRQRSLKMTTIHKWIGALSPAIFYAHSMTFGYAYLMLLSIVFMTNMLLGTINLDIIKNQKEWIFKLWMIMHVSMSIVITFIMLFHVGVVFYYK